MDLSIIIISYNTKELLQTCLTSLSGSLSKATFSYEVLVIDNNSADGTRELVTKQFPWANLVVNGENAGFGKANNQGIGMAKGEYILLLNSDTQVKNDAVGKLFAFSRQNPRSFIGAKLFNTDGTPQTSCGPFLTLPVAFAALFAKGDKLGLTRWSPQSIRTVDWVSGACIMAPKKAFADGLLFDEGIFMYMEEIDLLYRAKMKGYTTLFYPEAHIMHVGSGSSKEKRKGPVLNIYRGIIYFYKKHRTPLELRIVRLLLQWKALISLTIGKLTNNTYLTSTYEEAIKLV